MSYSRVVVHTRMKEMSPEVLLHSAGKQKTVASNQRTYSPGKLRKLCKAAVPMYVSSTLQIHDGRLIGFCLYWP